MKQIRKIYDKTFKINKTITLFNNVIEVLALSNYYFRKGTLIINYNRATI